MKRPWILYNHLFAAIETGDVDTATKVIDSGFDVDTMLMEGKPAIAVCIERCKLPIAQLLIKKGCSLSLKTSNGDYPLHLAVHSRNINLVKMLLDSRADMTAVNLFGKTALHTACEMNAEDIARTLIERSTVPELNALDIDWRTPLMYACQFSSKEVVEYLLLKGSEVNVEDVNGESPLLQCIGNPYSSPEMMQCLLNAGADVEHKNSTGETPLLRALRYPFAYLPGRRKESYQEMSLMLIDHGSNIKAVNYLGQSPLHLAVCANNDVLVKKLLNAGCATDVTDKLGLSPLFYACRNANKNIVNILIKSGADLGINDWHELEKVLQLSDFVEIAHYLMQRKKEVQSLSALCRFIIRKQFSKSIEKHAELLPIPKLLCNYIIQFDE